MSNGTMIWGNLLPKGPHIQARDGRRWTYDPAEIIAAFKADPLPLAVDYEHSMDLLKPGEKAVAAGWIVDLSGRNGELWGLIELTERAANSVAEREYRFLSVSMKRDTTGRMVRLVGAGLVNRPALPVQALEFDRNHDIGFVKSLARLAENHLMEQAALGRKISISQAVTAVMHGRH